MPKTDPPLRLTRVVCPICGSEEGTPFARGRDFEYETVEEEFCIEKCPRCGVLFLNPRPAVSEIDRIYPDEYAPYHFDRPSLTLRLRDRRERASVRNLASLIPEHADVLDVGCGSPRFLMNLKRHGRPGWRLWGNDIATPVLDGLRRCGFNVLPGRFEDVSAADAIFDAIFLKQVIEHLDSPLAILNTAQRLLRPGGLLVIETPNFRSWDAAMFRARYWGGYHIPRHWTIFSDFILRGTAERLGFATRRCRFNASPSFWVQSIHHMLMDKGFPRAIYGRFSYLDPPVMAVAVLVDILQRLITGRTSNMQFIFEKP